MKEAYNKAIKALEALHLELPTAPPTWEQVKALKLKLGADDVLVIAPSLSDTFTLDNLLAAYDKFSDTKHYIYSNLWDQYTIEEHNNGYTDWQVAVIKGGAKNVYKDWGVHHTNLTLEKQRAKVDPNQSITISQFVLLATQFKLDGKELTPNTWIRMVHYPDKTVGGDSLVGRASSDGGRLVLGGSGGGAGSGVGVGLSVGMNISTSALALSPSSSLSLEAPELVIQSLMFNGRKYVLEESQ